MAARRVRLATGRSLPLSLRAGVDTAEWAWDRPDLARPGASRAGAGPRQLAGPGRHGHRYLGTLRLPGRFVDGSCGSSACRARRRCACARRARRRRERARAIGPLDRVGLRERRGAPRRAAATPRVRLFEVRGSLGPARVVESAARAADASAVLDVLRAPTRLGVDPRREALARGRRRGVELPEGSRSQAAEVARAAGGRIEVRGGGPGLLVVGEG